MDEARKDIQGSSKLTQQSVQTSQITGDTKQAPTLSKFPFSLAISPKEFCMLEAACHSIATRSDRAIKHKKYKRCSVWHFNWITHGEDKLIQNESHHNKKDTLKYMYIFITISHEFLSSALSMLARK